MSCRDDCSVFVNKNRSYTVTTLLDTLKCLNISSFSKNIIGIFSFRNKSIKEYFYLLKYCFNRIVRLNTAGEIQQFAHQVFPGMCYKVTGIHLCGNQIPLLGKHRGEHQNQAGKSY